MNTIKEATRFLLALAYYLCYLLPLASRNRRVVLYYHGVTDEERLGFERQMRALTRRASIVPLMELVARSSVRGTAVALTFDDAFRNVLHNAAPIVKSLGGQITIFAPMANLGTPPAWSIEQNCGDRAQEIMNGNELRQVHAAGHEVFSHTLTHPRLTDIDDQKAYAELKDSRVVLEELIRTPVPAISYPHGAHDDRIVKLAQRAGYSVGFTIEPMVFRTGHDPLRIGRTAVSPTDRLWVFLLKANGAYEILTRLRSFKGRS